MADKQLKANRKFMEEQAAEREQERDEFSKELDKLRIVLKEKDKDKTSHENFEKEVKFQKLSLFVDFAMHKNFLYNRKSFLFSSHLYAR